jgi:hypothetical protein
MTTQQSGCRTVPELHTAHKGRRLKYFRRSHARPPRATGGQSCHTRVPFQHTTDQRCIALVVRHLPTAGELLAHRSIVTAANPVIRR